ncbi:hypothetical protein [Helicobacter sp. MIT 01-3238]|uniref:hypothetical protein n=1 Tax=Helicobacter sp. MIT 01-3238 TaxID=398627 RepID=UPI000E1F083F|nr:hypothetical protein [Helicobacter sp. MIT 01-3238]RDU55143.1 hypothetical protein CQA40_01565 [Helicobacter sp. MIT 01-3238]
MTSFILLVIAGVVVYYLYTTFEEYLKNPLPSPQKPQERQDYSPKDNPYSLPTPQDKLKNSYAGASVAMLNILLQAGISQKNPSLLQVVLLDNFIKNLHLQESQETILKQMLNGIDFSQIISKKSTTQSPATSTDSKDSDTPISNLAQIFLDNTYGEYKKRLHFVGFALTLAWSDRVLEEKEREVILDIAAFLQLENDEFNELYDSFENRFGEATSEADKADTNLVEQYKKELEAKQEQSSLQEAYQSLIQKLCSKSQVASEPQAELLAKLLALESAYNAKNA